MSAAALELHNVGKRFGKDTVLKDVSLRLEAGNTLVLFGPSGAGKTVLLRLIAGVIEPSEGVILIDGKDMFDAEPEERNLGMAFQNFALFPHMNAFDNIASPLVARKYAPSKLKATVETIAKLLKIDHVLSHAPRELSNGQKQRTALARALAAQPRLLLLDDPLRNVDAKLRFEMRLELPRLLAQQGTSVVYVTQDYKEAMALGTHIAVLDDAGVAQYGTPEDIYLRPRNTAIARLFGDPTINLLPVTLDGSGDKAVLQFANTHLPLQLPETMTAGQQLLMGLRPEFAHFCDATNPGAIKIDIEAETPLNEKIVTLVITEEGTEILLSRPVDAVGPSSGENWISFSTNQLLFFDATTGESLAGDKFGTAVSSGQHRTAL